MRPSLSPSPSLPHARHYPTNVRALISFCFLFKQHCSLLNSFQALDAYIQSQKTLLARTQSDLDRLRRIRDQAATHPDPFFESLDEKVSSSPLALNPLNLTIAAQ